MKTAPVYRLADSTLVEPLVNSWSAWSRLVAPVPASLHLMNYQLKTLRSYLANPEYHVNANRDPDLVGGAFVDITPDRAHEVAELLAKTEAVQARSLELARVVTDYQNWLADEATGQSMEPFYREMPELLRGRVELVYDYYNRPTARFVEGMLYGSEFYDKGLQSLRISTLKRDGSRTFFKSTPRLMEPDQLDWVVPFDSEKVDELFGLDAEPQPLGRILEILGLDASDAERLLPFLTEQPAALPETWSGPGVRVRYLGHACVLMEWGGVSVITDPYVGVVPEQGGVERFSYRDLPRKIDYALVTHNHQDHFALETLLRLRHRIGCLVVPKAYGMVHGDSSLKMMAQKLGFKNVVEMDSMESLAVRGGEIIAVPFFGEHADLAHGKSAYVVRAGRESVMFAADADCLDARIYQQVRASLGDIETVFLGTECVGAPLSWDCGPLFPRKVQHQHDQTRRYHGCDAKAALELLEAVGAKRLYNYAMGMEPWLEHILGLGLSEDSVQVMESNRLLAKARARGFLASERPFGKCDIYLGGGEAGRVSGSYLTGARLPGALPCLEIPTDRERESVQPYLSARQHVELPAHLRESLRRLCERDGHGLESALLAGFKLFLHSYAMQEDVFVGVAEDSATPDAVSLCLTHTDLSGDPTFQTLVERVSRVLSATRARREVLPAPQAEDGGRNACAQVIPAAFAFNHPMAEALMRRGVTFNVLEPSADPLECELGLWLTEAGDSLAGVLQYNAALYDGGTVDLMIERLLGLLSAAATEPGRRLEDILLSQPRPEEADGRLMQELQEVSDAEDEFIF